MNDRLAQCVRSAAVAGWWTVLIAAIWLSAGWAAYLWVMNAKPEWMMTLWGGGLTWSDVQALWIRVYLACKVIIFIGLLLTIWLTILARKLAKTAGQ